MIIRPEQFEALGLWQRRLFVDQMVQHLDESYPGRIKKDYGLDTRAFVEAGMEKAATYGIGLEPDIESFLEMLVEWGPDFDTAKEWAAEILNNTKCKGSDKILLLEEHERFGD
ncbi:MAG: hypothetical protein ACM3S5_11000 [Rhodospirillales bacterium]